MTKAQRLLKEVEELAVSSQTWADFSNALFDPEDGLLSRGFPLGPARADFIKTPEYQRVQELFRQVMKRTGVVEGATPRKSGKFVVRLPYSLHSALESEARAEGVSLNQLVVTKLAVQLKDAVRPKKRRAG